MGDVIGSPLSTRKTKPKGRHPRKALSAAFVRSAPPGKHCDGNGLYLFVKPNGARSWIQRLVIRGRRRDFGLGGVSLVSLAEAREKARANRKLAREGGDPLTERRRTHNMPTFAEAAARVVQQKRSGWRNPRQAHDWMASLLRWNQIAAVPHGFRSSFRDWAAEETDHPREVVEAALAHVVKNKVEAAYGGTDLFERRRVLMEDWASYLAGGSRQPASVRLR